MIPKIIATSLLALTLAALGACAASTKTTPNAVSDCGLTQNVTGTELTQNGTAKEALLAYSTDPDLKAQAAADLEPYRITFDAATQSWIVYGYSPSKAASYAALRGCDRRFSVSVVNEPALAFQPNTGNSAIDIHRVSIDAAAAATTAAAHVSVSASDTVGFSEHVNVSATGADVGADGLDVHAGGDGVGIDAGSASENIGLHGAEVGVGGANMTLGPDGFTVPGWTINGSGIHFDPRAVASNTPVPASMTLDGIGLISATAYSKSSGIYETDPVWVCVINGQTLYVDATSGVLLR